MQALQFSCLLSSITYCIPRLLDSLCLRREEVDARVRTIFDTIADTLRSAREAIISVVGRMEWNFYVGLCENAWISVFVLSYLAQLYHWPMSLELIAFTLACTSLTFIVRTLANRFLLSE